MARPWNWEAAANIAEEVYGVYVNWEERYFVCPECDDVVYECDWEDEDLSVCPICGYEFYEDLKNGR